MLTRCAVLFAACAPLLAQDPADKPAVADAFARLAARYDADKDGRITRKEYPRGDEHFANLDRDGDGVITRADFTARGRRPAARERAPERPPEPKLPKVGDRAPDFALPMLGMKDTVVKLSSFADQQPVALIFGSYT